MMIAQQIQQLNKHDFLEYIHQLQLLAKEKFSFDIFVQNRLSQNNKFEQETNVNPYISNLLKSKGIPKNVDLIEKTESNTNPAVENILKYAGILKDVDLSDISEEELYLQGD